MLDVELAPQYIRNTHDLHKSIKLGETSESITLDFKLELSFKEISKNKKNDIAEEVALDICQFANTWGGVLLIGVKEERQQSSGRKVASEYINVTNADELSEFLGNNVLPLIYPPDIGYDIVSVVIQPEIQIVAINIFPLTMGASCVYVNAPPYSAKYPYRTHYGKKYLHPAEIEKRMTHGDRSILIKLREISSKTRDVKLYPEVEKQQLSRNDTWDSKGINIILKNISTYEYSLNVNGIDINIPFSLTRDVWLTEDGKMGILLNTHLSVSPDRKSVLLNL